MGTGRLGWSKEWGYMGAFNLKMSDFLYGGMIILTLTSVLRHSQWGSMGTGVLANDNWPYIILFKDNVP